MLSSVTGPRVIVAVTCVSMVTAILLGLLPLPAASRWFAMMNWKPSDRVPVVKSQLPFASTVVVPEPAPEKTVIVAPGSPVPVTVSSVSLVRLSPIVPVSSLKPVMTGCVRPDQVETVGVLVGDGGGVAGGVG